MSDATSSLIPPQTPDRRSLLQNALQALESMEAKLAAVEQARTEPIAVIGMSCRYPGGVDSPERFWSLLREGRDAVTPLPPDRRQIAELLGANPDGADGKPAWWGGFLDRIDQFDPQFFGITPREALTMDPQQRVVLEVAWEALERAGQAPDKLSGSPTGVFLGISINDYGSLVQRIGYKEADVYAATGGSLNVAAGRVAFTLGLQGPCMAVDTACSSSLVAVHLATQSLRNGECRMALAGGVNAVLMPDGFVLFSNWGMMASDGRCKTFDAAADGFVRSEGCGILVLKRLSDALADGDTVLALIRGTAVNQDGRSSGLTVPNGLAQQIMLRKALENAGIEPAQVQYIEAHGTGTAVGDPIEVEAIGAVLGKGRTADQPLYLGSVKTNIGHAESAAGVAGLIKVILSMQHGEIPPHLHLRERSPKIPWPRFAIEIPATPTPWPGRDGQRIAGVSAFGFSGTNAHIVLTSPPAVPARTAERAMQPTHHLLTLSAKSDAALRTSAERFAAHLHAHPTLDLADLSFTANTGRARFAHRLAVVGTTPAEIAGYLSAFATGAPVAGGAGAPLTSGQGAGAQPKVVFLFTGQGAQYAGMGKALYESAPVFRAAVDRCAALLAPHMDRPLLDLLYGDASSSLDQTAYTQPALFALEYALSELWRSWGVIPAAVMGHSVGEYVAAVVAGVLSLEDGLALIAARGRLMQSLPSGGAMAAIFVPAEQVQAAIAASGDRIAIAAVNGPEHTVISGDATAVDAITGQFAATGVRVQRLTVSHAFHSPLMDPILDAFERTAATIPFHAPRIPLVSNVSGELAGAEIATPGYWRRHVRQAVRFDAGLETLRRQGFDLFVEVGPHPTLLGMAQHAQGAGHTIYGVPSLRKGRDDQQQILAALGALYVRGVVVDWAAYSAGAPRRKLALPTYPFQRSRYWVDLPARGARLDRQAGHSSDAGEHPLLGRRTASPLLREILFESSVSATTPAFLADHQIQGSIIFPGTGYMEMALAAAATCGPQPHTVASLSIRDPLVLEDRPYTLQLMLTPEEEGTFAFQIAGFFPDDPNAVHTHAIGTIHATHTEHATPSAPPPAVELDALRAECPELLDLDEFYRHLRSIGLDYGPAFTGIEQIGRRDGAALGLIRLPASAGSSMDYQLHPALFDACFHTIGAALPALDLGLPISIAGLRLYRPTPNAVWCHVQIMPTEAPVDQVLTCRLRLFDEEGEIVAELERLEVLRVARGAFAANADWFHQMKWRAQPHASAPTATADGEWLILTDDAASAGRLVQLLEERGGRCLLITPATGDTPHTPGQWLYDPSNPDTLADALREATRAPGLRGAITLWAEAAMSAPATLETLWERERLSYTGTLQLAQTLAERSNAPRLWIVTYGAQPVDDARTAVTAADAALWGLSRVIASEHPALRSTSVDLDPTETEISLAAFVDELLEAGREDQIAFRSAMRYVARLTRHSAPAGLLPAGEPYRLALPERGALNTLVYQPLGAREPGPGEIAIEVHATGLNFRDVLNVLGMYPGDPGPPGIECAGLVAAVGEGVEDIRVGDAVVGLAPRSLDAIAITPANLVAHKPDSLSFAEAVTVPSAFLTAWYGLTVLAKLQPGERVLIHAAAGGVGLAAVQIAQRIGAEVFATAGSPAKHAHLRALGITHIFSSRTPDFPERMLELTGGRGIDVVLNSLADEFIPASVAVLAPRGRFLELGKRGIWTAEQMAAARPEAFYAPYDLGDPLREEPETLRRALCDLLALMEEGALTPLPLRAFPAEFVVDAFRYMAQARHIGKVVVTHRPTGWRSLIQPDGAYLVSGGLGGLGLTVAGWLADQGARALALVGRRPPSAEAEEAIRRMREAGVEVQIIAADIAHAPDVVRVLEQLRTTGRPLRGVIHAAGVLDDGVLAQQSWQRFEKVFAPKGAGAWLLHSLTRGAPLDFFVLFSSASAILGNAGQANYAAANAYLDALAHERRAAGLPALSINWGAWSGVGMAAALAAETRDRLAGRGSDSIAPEQGVRALERALRTGDAQTAILPVRWATLLAQFPEGATPPLLTEIAHESPRRAQAPASQQEEAASFRKRLSTSAPAERQALLAARLATQLGRVLGLDPSHDPDPAQGFADFGMDSLMAVELKNRLEADLHLSVPLASLFENNSINALATTLAAHFADGAADAENEQTAQTLSPQNGNAQGLLNRLDQLSDADVDALLEEMLNEQEGST